MRQRNTTAIYFYERKWIEEKKKGSVLGLELPLFLLLSVSDVITKSQPAIRQNWVHTHIQSFVVSRDFGPFLLLFLVSLSDVGHRKDRNRINCSRQMPSPVSIVN